MKQCPKCGSNYTDDTLRFCLADGTPLAEADEQPTVVRAGDPHKTEQLPPNITGGVRVDNATSAQGGAPHTQPQMKSGSSTVIKVVIALLVLGGLAIVGLGILGAGFYVYTGRQTIATVTPTPAATPWNITSPSPGSDDGDLAKEIEKLKKELQRTTNSNIDITVNDNGSTSFGRTATINSPNDGFLALRNLPSVDIGDRVAKVPHGARVSIFVCSEESDTVSGRSGHWCMANYEGKTGWLFDAWLSFADPKN